MAEQILPEMQDITRQRDLAKMLLQRGMTDNLQGQMVSGRYVGASPLQGIANMYSAYKGKQLSEESDRKQAELSRMLRQQTMQDLQGFGQAVQGREAIPEVVPQGQTLRDDQGQLTMGSQQGVSAVAPDYNKGLSILMGSRSPQSQALGNMMLADMLKTQKLGPEETLVRGNFQGGFTPVAGEVGAKKTNDIRNYEYDVKNSGFQGSFNDWLTSQKKAGATNVSVGGAKDLAGQVGDISKESRISAMGAVQTADAANRIIQAVDSNKLFSGVGATQRLTLAQLADGLGFGGKDTAEKIANSRQAIQGLAQLTLQGRKQMRGEGAITQSEGELAERAMSGEIKLTGPEIRQLAEAAKRSAKFQYSQHQNIINTMKSRPDTRDLVPFYDVPADASIFNPRVVGGQSNVRNEADAILGGSNR
jgi:hypothetical protein